MAARQYKLAWRLPGVRRDQADTVDCEYRCRSLPLALKHWHRLTNAGLLVELREQPTNRLVVSRRR